MAGTSEGGKKSHNTILRTRGREYIRERNARGGRASKGGAFTDPEFAKAMAQKSHQSRRKGGDNAQA